MKACGTRASYLEKITIPSLVAEEIMRIAPSGELIRIISYRESVVISYT
jgi:hypothetical protein